MKKILVVYYSFTGHTKRIAQEISKILKADIDEITSLKKIPSAIDIFFKKRAKANWKKNPSDYDLMIVGTPIWAWAATPEIMTYLENNKGKIKNIAFFCTYENNIGKTFEKMAKISKRPLATLKLKFKRFEKPEISPSYMNEIKEFCRRLKR